MKKQLTMGILAHVDAGKTTLSEGILYHAGVIKEMGRVEKKNTFMDTDDIEKQPDVGPYSLKAVRTLDKVLDLERFGFTRVEEPDEDKILKSSSAALSIKFEEKQKDWNKKLKKLGIK